MPLLPLPPGVTSLAGGTLPVTSAADVLAEFPDEHRIPVVAPVRDAFTEGFASGVLEYQTEAARAAAQSDPTRATGIYLDLHGEDRDVRRRPNELDAAYRARIFATPAVVTPEALIAGIDDILAAVTAKRVQLVELGLDGWFVHNGTATWDSFIATGPRYPDRLYPYDSVANGGFFAPDTDPGGAIPMSSLNGHAFHVRIPSIDGVDAITIALVNDTGDDGVFLFDGGEVLTTVTQHIFSDAVAASEIYAAIVDFVQRAKGQGIVWSAYVDPSL